MYLLDMFDFSQIPENIDDLWDYAVNVLSEAVTHIDDSLNAMMQVIGQINNVDITTESLITQFVGNIRYIIGDGLFVPLMILVSLAYGIALWNLILKLIKAIKSAWENKIKIKL